MRRRPPEDPAKKILKVLDAMDGETPSADVVSISAAKEARHFREVAEIQEIETMPMQQVRKRLVQDGLDPDEVERDGKAFFQKLRNGLLCHPKNE